MPADGGLVPLIVFLPLSAGKPLDRVVMLTVAIPPGRTSGVTRYLMVRRWPNGDHYVAIGAYLIAAVADPAPAHAVRRTGSATADCPARRLPTSWAGDRPLSARFVRGRWSGRDCRLDNGRQRRRGAGRPGI
jgi:hypothetical protein